MSFLPKYMRTSWTRDSRHQCPQAMLSSSWTRNLSPPMPPASPLSFLPVHSHQRRLLLRHLARQNLQLSRHRQRSPRSTTGQLQSTKPRPNDAIVRTEPEASQDESAEDLHPILTTFVRIASTPPASQSLANYISIKRVVFYFFPAAATTIPWASTTTTASPASRSPEESKRPWLISSRRTNVSTPHSRHAAYVQHSRNSTTKPPPLSIAITSPPPQCRRPCYPHL
jgi:hypothetical protein